jgi:hypothetical protein
MELAEMVRHFSHDAKGCILRKNEDTGKGD